MSENLEDKNVKQSQDEEGKKKTENRKDKRRLVVIELLLLVILVLLLLKSCGVGDPISPDYPPKGTEDNQTPIDGDESEKMESEEGGGAINVTYQMDVTVSLSEEKVSLYYANPNASNQNVAILLMVDDLVVAKTDIIEPGNKVTELPLESYAKSKLQVGGYDAELVVRSYNPENGEKAMIDTRGAVNLTVEE